MGALPWFLPLLKSCDHCTRPSQMLITALRSFSTASMLMLPGASARGAP